MKSDPRLTAGVWGGVISLATYLGLAAVGVPQGPRIFLGIVIGTVAGQSIARNADSMVKQHQQAKEAKAKKTKKGEK